MDTNDNEFSALDCPTEVMDDSSNGNNGTEVKRKRKRSILLMEYLCKGRKRHAINKEKKKLCQEESYAGKYQDDTKFRKESVDNDGNIARKRRHVKSRLGLYQSKLKNNRYVKQLMKTNPIKYAEEFGKEKQKQNKMKAKKEKKNLSSAVQYILNEHTGNLEKKESVQNPSCRKCNGVVKRHAETQVHATDIHGKVFRNTSIQCEIL